MKNNFSVWWLFIGFGILVVIANYRFTGLTVSPPGFYKDEAAMTINGYSVLKTGRDEHGIGWPVFFKSFGDWKSPLFIYSQLPILGIVGEDIWATRLTSALWGMATVLLFGYLIQLQFGKKWLTLVSLAILGFLPWHFHFSRIGFELITLPFFFTIYLTCLVHYEKTRNPRWQYRAALSLAGLFYTYAASKFYSLLYFFWHLWLFRKSFRLRVAVGFVLSFSLVLLPAIYWAWVYPEAFSSRLSSIAITTQTQDWQGLVRIYLKGYLDHYSIPFWFVEGGDNIRHSPQFHYPLLWVTALPLGLGLITVFWQWRLKLHQVVLFSLLTFPALSAWTTNAPHVHRIIQMMPIVAYLMVLGIYQLDNFFRAARERFIKAKAGIGHLYFLVILLLSLGFIYEWKLFSTHYFSEYKKVSEVWFQVHDIKAIQKLLKYPLPHLVSDQVAEYYPTTYQLLRKMSPLEIQSRAGQITYLDTETIEKVQPGHYLLTRKDCESFVSRFPQAILVEWIHSEFCIYRVR